MYIKAAEYFIAERFSDPQKHQGELKKLTGFHLRRTNKFIMLSLLGAHSCMKAGAYPADIPVYFATENGNLYDTEIVLAQIYRSHSFPKPINFINTMSNVAAFYIAQSLNITGPNIMVSAKGLSFERALDLARAGFMAGTSSALVGAVDEAVFSGAVFERNFGHAPGETKLVEASGWMHLSADESGAIGEIVEAGSFPDADEALEWLSEIGGISGSVASFGIAVGPEERRRWIKLLGAEGEYDYISELGYNDSITVCGIISFVKKFRRGVLVNINRDESDRHAVTLVRSY